MGKLDRTTLIGLVMCALPVAAFSAYSQFWSAHLAGYPLALAWVLPIATDASGFVATRVWMTAEYAKGIRRYAALIALACIALSFGGAAAHLAFLDGAIPTWFRLVVGGLPSIALGAVIHLGALLTTGKSAPAKPAKSKSAPKAAGGIEHRASTSASSVSIPGDPIETGSTLARGSDGASRAGSSTPAAVSAANTEPVPAIPEIGTGSVSGRMLAYLDRNGETTGAELDRMFGTKDYGRGVLRTWRKRHPVASGE